MKSAQTWFDEYGESHQNPLNKAIHWLMVPVIFFTVAAALYALPFPFVEKQWWCNWAAIVLVPVLGFYLRLGLRLGLGMALFSALCLWLADALAHSAPWPVWAIAAVLFAIAWVFQFVGHAIEGKRPSFFKDMQFLLIGPAWLLGFILRSVGLRY